ncbi:MAG TPA: ATP-binding protein [Blastocatellia bacterium]|nr:ATP-binding protein [Blastocatellia bacterium]
MQANPKPSFVTEVRRTGVNWDEVLRSRLVVFKEKYGWTNNQVSREMQRFYGRQKGDSGRANNTGMGQSTIYNYLACKWASSQEMLERFENRLRGWLDHREASGKTEEVDEDVTSARLIQHGLAEAYSSRQFVTIIGPSGMGKTIIAKHFANLNTRGGMIIVEAYDGMTPRAFLAAICSALGDIDTGSKDALIKRARGLLAEQPKLLAIDEANFLRDESINHLVHIWNQAKSGIVLLGTQELELSIRSSKLQRVQSRLKVSITLGVLSDEEIRRRLEESFEPKEVTAQVVQVARAGSFGRYRDLDTLINTVSDKREEYPTATLEKLFERFSTRQEGKKKG